MSFQKKSQGYETSRPPCAQQPRNCKPPEPGQHAGQKKRRKRRKRPGPNNVGFFPAAVCGVKKGVLEKLQALKWRTTGWFRPTRKAFHAMGAPERSALRAGNRAQDEETDEEDAEEPSSTCGSRRWPSASASTWRSPVGFLRELCLFFPPSEDRPVVMDG